VAGVLPLLYLDGLSSSDFGSVLEEFLGTSHGLSAATITGLTPGLAERGGRVQPALTGRRRLRLRAAGGIHLKVRLALDKVCLLVMIGVRADGTKELIPLVTDRR
jgi:transposase-like protein